MSVNFQTLAPIIAACATSGGIIFQMGKQSEKLEIIGLKVEAQEKKYSLNNEKVCEIYNKLNVLQNNVSNIKEDITEIKSYIKN
jgi:peptidoglycan hydrolase CwlO-like protein|tara:strand:- start:21 stop:272 length:252 start_codon:yes stop_codon:yes gene_type:complete